MQQREIKFRAWNGKEMSEPFEIEEICNECGTYCFSGGAHGPEFKFGECDLMRFTGLLDKNGKEVYEGDLVNAKYLFQGQVREIRNAPVTYLEGDGAFVFGTPGTGFVAWIEVHLNDRKEIEVVGNVFENPELLNKQ